MADPQGLFEYTGIKKILSGTFTFGHGISPSIAVIEIPPATNFAVPSGTLTIRYGSLTLTFPDCCLDMASLSASRGGQTWTIRVKDRRWKWAYGRISGVYNQRTPDGEFDAFPEKKPKELTAAILKSKGDKTPQELAILLLKAMGEKNYDVSQLPNKTRPAVSWDGDNPAEQLARLCDSLGCRVVLGTDNRVRLCLLGSGQSLPTDRITSGGYGFDPPEMPDSLMFIGGPTLYQLRFVLEAVGLDLDGIIKPIKDLSYNPYGVGEKYGWCGDDPEVFYKLMGENETNVRNRTLALSCVYRWYRIVQPATLDWKIPHFGEIKSIKQVLPIYDRLIDTQDYDLKAPPVLDSEMPQAARAIVSGIFFNNVGDPKTYVNTPVGTKYPGSFSFDGDRGLVIFDNPMHNYVWVNSDLTAAPLPPDPNASPGDPPNPTRVIVTSGSLGVFPAKLILECTCNVRDQSTRTPERYEVERKLTNDKYGTGPRPIKREDERLEVRARYKSRTNSHFDITRITTVASAEAPLAAETLTDTLTNEMGTGLNAASSGLKDRATYYLDAAQAMYQPKKSVTFSYLKIMDLSPDGKIHQITWRVGRGGATTEASENSEFDLAVPSYGERRQAEIARQERIDITNGSKK